VFISTGRKEAKKRKKREERERAQSPKTEREREHLKWSQQRREREEFLRNFLLVQAKRKESMAKNLIRQAKNIYIG
jgi:L-lactate utilization protein LutC